MKEMQKQDIDEIVNKKWLIKKLVEFNYLNYKENKEGFQADGARRRFCSDFQVNETKLSNWLSQKPRDPISAHNAKAYRRALYYFFKYKKAERDLENVKNKI